MIKENTVPNTAYFNLVIFFFLPVEQSGIQENVWNKWSFCHMVNLMRLIFFECEWRKSQLFEYLTFNKILPFIGKYYVVREGIKDAIWVLKQV